MVGPCGMAGTAQARKFAAMSTSKTNAVRLLERAEVPHRLLVSEVDPDDLAADSIARRIGLPTGPPPDRAGPDRAG